MGYGCRRSLREAIRHGERREVPAVSHGNSKLKHPPSSIYIPVGMSNILLMVKHARVVLGFY